MNAGKKILVWFPTVTICTLTICQTGKEPWQLLIFPVHLKPNFQLIDTTLNYRLLCQESQCIFAESCFSVLFLSAYCASVSSNPAALTNSGCPLGLDTTHLHLLCEAFAHAVNRFFAEVRHLELLSEQQSRRVSTEKTNILQ